MNEAANDAALEGAVIESVASNHYGLSWIAYSEPLIVFLGMFVVSLFLGSIHVALTYIGGALAFALMVYKILALRSVRLFVNDEGVWVYSGILPWTKGISGIRWRDIDDARYFPGFLGWALKSYTVSIGHRFTKSSQIRLPYVKRGDRAVEQINALHGSFLRNGGGQ